MCFEQKPICPRFLQQTAIHPFKKGLQGVKQQGIQCSKREETSANNPREPTGAGGMHSMQSGPYTAAIVAAAAAAGAAAVAAPAAAAVGGGSTLMKRRLVRGSRLNLTRPTISE